MSNQTVSPEFLERIQGAQKRVQQIQMELGAIALQELRKNMLLGEVLEIQKEMDGITKELNETYGEGELNVETGEFKPYVAQEVL